MDVIREEDQKLIVVSANGYGKVTSAKAIATHARGGVGIRVAGVTDKTGSIVAVHTLDPAAKEVIMMSTKGQRSAWRCRKSRHSAAPHKVYAL